MSTPNVKGTLRARFEEFIVTLPGVESVDSLVAGRASTNEERADYLAEDSRLIIELKTLESDTEPKVEKILKPHRSRTEFPIFFDKWELTKVLKYLPDGDEIHNQIIQSISTSVRAIFRKANKQVSSTKDIFQLSSSQGLLIILNKSVEIVTPSMLHAVLQKIALSKKEDGEYRYVDVGAVILISEAHGKVLQGNVLAHPVLVMPFTNVQPFDYHAFVHHLINAWAQFNGVPLFNAQAETEFAKSSDFEKMSFLSELNRTEGPRQQAWSRYYNSHNPYFRGFDDDRLRWFFKIIIYEIGRGLIKGGTREESERSKLFWMEVFSHFMDEVQNRGIDIRYFTSDEKVWNEVDDLMERRFPDFERPDRAWVDEWSASKKKPE